MSKLFSPLILRDVTFRNRLVISPMCQYSSVEGFATHWHLVHLGSRAVGGAGLIIQEATAVSPEGRITPGDLGLYRDDHVEKLQEITSFIHEQGAVAGIQLAHAGRKASCAAPWKGGLQLGAREGGWKTVAPSPMAFNRQDDPPQALDQPGIDKVVQDFKSAARRAHRAGYKVVEIHAAHGYLIHEFLSPLSNQRTDRYGGSLENRMRLLLEIVQAVKSVWPSHLPLLVRISATDWVEEGWDTDEAVVLCTILKEHGVDLIDCSSGGLVPYAKIPAAPGFQVPFAQRIRREAGILTGAVGLITGVQQSEEILQKEMADLILLARTSLREPYFALHAAHILGEDIAWPVQYQRAKLT